MGTMPDHDGRLDLYDLQPPHAGIFQGRLRRIPDPQPPHQHPKPLSAGSQGNFQQLPDGNFFVGWGSAPYFSEFTPAGQTIFDVQSSWPFSSLSDRFPSRLVSPKSLIFTSFNPASTSGRAETAARHAPSEL